MTQQEIAMHQETELITKINFQVKDKMKLGTKYFFVQKKGT